MKITIEDSDSSVTSFISRDKWWGEKPTEQYLRDDDMMMRDESAETTLTVPDQKLTSNLY